MPFPVTETHQPRADLVRTCAFSGYLLDSPRKYRGVVFCGPMCVGKSTFAQVFAAGSRRSEIIPLAKKLKDLCIEMYGMSPDPDKKDRPLLQKVGDAMRSVDEDVFVNYMVYAASHKPGYFLVCDDGRRLNEFRRLRSAGFLLVFLQVDEEIRMRRVKDLYPNAKPEDMGHETETESSTAEAMAMYHLVLANNNLLQMKQAICTVCRSLGIEAEPFVLP